MMVRNIIGFFVMALVAGGGYLGWQEAVSQGRFPLQEIHFTGVNNTNVDKALELIAIDKGTNLFALDLDTVKKNLLTLPWIRSVRVKRVFPNLLSIIVTEKVAVCMGKEDNRLNLFDEYGTTIKHLEAGDPLIFPVVIVPNKGKNLGARVVWLINLLVKHPWLRAQISEAVGYAGNRWVLYTNKGIKLLLSQNADNELELLMRLQKRYNILNRNIKQVELRIPGRAAVRMAGENT